MVTKQDPYSISVIDSNIVLHLQASKPAERELSMSERDVKFNATDEISCQTTGMPLTFRSLHYQFITKRSQAITGVLQLPRGRSFPDEKEGRMRKRRCSSIDPYHQLLESSSS